ncbi:zonular occludens toxin domain-containing protein [Paucibacter sediminis]|uniref:Zonular occludens toxin domain-containing protein n=1 Tax=Paucibacter sediminis TaxID=3019553 RepID=A0AA95NCF5_9BURK|nr:zonular occludens toxin domain-containing protein [Paucibacter sp. S2-9]WIT11128.1 zonular occludens toxin domain-containing protein [Paucibacter sp. S2-9]
MITLITGAPGAGKTAALVDLLLQLTKGRAVYCDGIPELQLPHVPLDDPKRWPELVEDGAAVVIDEVQRVWRPAGAGARVPAEIEALETHRHRGLDFFLITQHPNLLHQNVRRLVGRHIHLRDVGMLGRWWYEWPEATNPETFRAAPIKKRYSLPKRVFGKYKSASIHIKPIRSMPRSVLVLGAAVLALGGLGVRAYSSVSSKLDGGKPAAHVPMARASAPGPVDPVASLTVPAAVPMAPQAAASAPKVVGCIAYRDRCSCLGSDGFPVVVEWEACQSSARGFGGLVALNMDKPTEAPKPAEKAADSQPGPGLISFGGDPRSHILK